MINKETKFSFHLQHSAISGLKVTNDSTPISFLRLVKQYQGRNPNQSLTSSSLHTSTHTMTDRTLQPWRWLSEQMLAYSEQHTRHANTSTFTVILLMIPEQNTVKTLRSGCTKLS